MLSGKSLQFIMAFLIPITGILLSQTYLPTVAVLDFDARGISVSEAQTLTDRMASEMGNTGTVRLVERGMMAAILSEQDFQMSGCTSDECAVEVGQLLGAEYMVSASVGKIGKTYTVDAKYVSIETGAAVRTKNVSYQGEIDGLITEIEVLAWELLGLEIPKDLAEKRRVGTAAFLAAQASSKTKGGSLIRSMLIPGMGQWYSNRKISALTLGVAEMAIIGLAATQFTAYQQATTDYGNTMNNYRRATDADEIASYRSLAEQQSADIESISQQVQMLSAAAAGVWALNVIHAYIVGPRPKDEASRDRESGFELAYDPMIKSMKVRWEFALD